MLDADILLLVVYLTIFNLSVTEEDHCARVHLYDNLIIGR